MTTYHDIPSRSPKGGGFFVTLASLKRKQRHETGDKYRQNN
jgi:hypothetical protein